MFKAVVQIMMKDGREDWGTYLSGETEMQPAMAAIDGFIKKNLQVNGLVFHKVEPVAGAFKLA